MEDGMIVQLHTPAGAVDIDTLTVTDSELSALGLSRQWLVDTYGDLERMKELLANSPDVITQPEMWELVRLMGKHLGITT